MWRILSHDHNVIEVACAADESYAPHAAAMIHSLISTNPGTEVRTHFLHPPRFSADTVAQLSEMVSGLRSAIVFHEVADSAGDGLPAMGRISEVMWYRLALPELLPTTERVLYLDCDTLVLEPLAPLWQIDMQGRSVAAVTNVFPPDLLHRPDDLGIPRTDYFNSGVLLMDLNAWRADRWSERIVRLARSEPKRIVFPDQDALNIELRNSKLALHPRWNCQNSVLYLGTAEELLGVVPTAEARAHPAILHFEGPEFAKPWHYLSAHPFRQMYFDHRAQTPWPEVRLDGRTLPNQLRRWLPAPARMAASTIRQRLTRIESAE